MKTAKARKEYISDALYFSCGIQTIQSEKKGTEGKKKLYKTIPSV